MSVTQEEVDRLNKNAEAKGEKTRYKLGPDNHLVFDKPATNGEPPIRIEVENKTTEQLLERLKDTEDKLDEAESDSEIGREFKQKLVERLGKLGIDISEDKITDPEVFKAYVALGQDIERGRGITPERKSPSGSVPLTNQQRGVKAGYSSEGYDSMQELVRSLKLAEKSPNRAEAQESKDILNSLWQKKLPKALDRGPVVAQIVTDEDIKAGKGLKDIINENYRAKRKLGRSEE